MDFSIVFPVRRSEMIFRLKTPSAYRVAPRSIHDMFQIPSHLGAVLRTFKILSCTNSKIFLSVSSSIDITRRNLTLITHCMTVYNEKGGESRKSEDTPRVS